MAKQQTRLDRKRAFIRELAKFLAETQASKSIELEMGKPHAKDWSTLRAATPLRGYPSVDEAEGILADFLM